MDETDEHLDRVRRGAALECSHDVYGTGRASSRVTWAAAAAASVEERTDRDMDGGSCATRRVLTADEAAHVRAARPRDA